MTREHILENLSAQFPSLKFEIDENNPEAIFISASALIETAAYLKSEAKLFFELLNFVSAVDYTDHFELIYQFSSYQNNHRLVLKIKISRENPQIESLSAVYPTANWHEREVFDLFGVKFLNHPDLTRIFMPEDWEGHPMRKDFVHPNLIPMPEVD